MTITKVVIPSGTEFAVKHLLTVKQVREVRKKAGALLKLADVVLVADPDDDQKQLEIQNILLSKTDEQDELVAEILESACGLAGTELEAMSYLDALHLFSEIFRVSTTVPKNSKTPAGLQSL